MSPINSLFIRRLRECFSLTGRPTCHSEPASHGPCRTPRDVTVTARAGACAPFPELLAAELSLEALRLYRPWPFRVCSLFAKAASVFSHTRAHLENACCVLYDFFATHPGREGLLSRFTGEETEAQRGRPGQGHATSGNGGTGSRTSSY